ncbi:MAG: cob(I)yrinic acid a,c-diamide adenosyltransferase [Candidatus Omnitrophota bacterium]
MIHLYIGDGKGKTTSILGLALRAAGWKKSVYIAQFLKSLDSSCGELNIVKEYKLPFKIERFEYQTHPMFLKDGDFDKEKTEESVRQALEKIEYDLNIQRFDVFILDELLNGLELGIVKQQRIKELIRKAREVELVLTGREAPKSIIAMADYVSYIQKIKHPFDRKLIARKGIEY